VRLDVDRGRRYGFAPRRDPYRFDGVEATCVDAGMPTVLLVAAVFGIDCTRRIEHPSRFIDVEVDLTTGDRTFVLRRSQVLRTARKIFDSTVWPRSLTPNMEN